MEKHTIKNLDDLNQIAWELSSEIKGKELIILDGDLGAGKTTFTKYLLFHLGVEGMVNSPTFGIMKEYESNVGKVYHVDAYRLDSIDDIYDEMTSKSLRIVEWGSRIEHDLDKVNIRINFETNDIEDDETREVTITKTK